VTLRTVAVKGFQTAFVLAFAALLYSNWNLRRRLTEIIGVHARNGRVASSPFQAGQVAPTIHVVDVTGRALILGPEKWRRKSFLVFALPGCAACRTELQHAVQAGNADFTLVSLAPKSAAAGILKEVPPAVEAYFLDPIDAPRMKEHVDRVPRILRISGEGKIIAVCDSMAACGSARPAPAPACPTCTS
jgi:hypothetical protein